MLFIFYESKFKLKKDLGGRGGGGRGGLVHFFYKESKSKKRS